MWKHDIDKNKLEKMEQILKAWKKNQSSKEPILLFHPECSAKLSYYI